MPDMPGGPETSVKHGVFTCYGKKPRFYLITKEISAFETA